MEVSRMEGGSEVHILNTSQKSIDVVEEVTN